MSVNMLIETQHGFGYTGAECRMWMADVGFRDSYLEPLTGRDSMGRRSQVGRHLPDDDATRLAPR